MMVEKIESACYNLPMSTVYRVVASHILRRGEVVHMSEVYQILTLLFLGGTFLLALLAYIDKHKK